MLTNQQLFLQYYQLRTCSYYSSIFIPQIKGNHQYMYIHTSFQVPVLQFICTSMQNLFVARESCVRQMYHCMLNAGKIHAQFYYNVCYTYVHYKVLATPTTHFKLQVDIIDHTFVDEWMQDFETFHEALQQVCTTW